ncbi:protein O-mannosyl-transferase TMTC2-like [Hydractinia symbiolongicarpus]|uniref:protein O-mannosyl-transferase TMTC2-like n=1 Tax=Hydractinia symbiolongicarpus TaxID=13093 RepID=UPI00254CDD4F|nr:protein O-mannosyl-transferase TMTC2-like [Hydractinia symbiolongicarpus]XP_057315404.1 protein O-mannosyl-transferase TMTC2-like [Hydractinia symbiolongicarpus]
MVSKKYENASWNINKRFCVPLRISFFVVLLCSFACYSNTLQAGFVYDDTRAILRNKDLLPSKPIANLFLNDFWGTPLTHSGSHKSYRPLCVLTFRLNYLFGELNPWGYHFVNNLLHSLVSCLFTFLCYKIFCKQWLAFFGGLMFALHPVHTEAVAGVVGRADVGSALFFITALICYQNATNEVRCRHSASTNVLWLFFTLLCSLCSMYTKEQGVTVLGVIVVYEILIVSRCNIAVPTSVLGSLKASGGLWRVILISLYTLGILYTRLLIMGHSPPEFAPADNPAANDPNLLTRFLTFLYLPVCNLWLLVYPWNLSYDWSMNTIPLVETLTSIENLGSSLLYFTLLLAAYLYLQYQREISDRTRIDNVQSQKLNGAHKTHKEEPQVHKHLNDTTDILNYSILSLAAMILPFLPATNLFFYVGFVIAERILYIPSIGFCLLILNGVNILTRVYSHRHREIVVLMTVVLLMFGLKTYNRNFVWKDEESLYRSGIALSPAKSYGNLANVFVRQKKFKEAEDAYRSALRFRYNMADTHYNLGILLQNQNRFEEAILCYKDAIQYRPRLAAAHLNLGVTLLTVGKKQESLEVLMNAYNISDHGLKDPAMHATSLTNIRYNAGRVLFELGRYTDCVEVFFDALKRMPDGYEPHSIYNMIGQVYSQLNKESEAETWYLKALKFKPDHVPALLTYGKHLVSTGIPNNLKTAEEYFLKALQISPDKIECYMIYGHFLLNSKRPKEAVELLKKVLDFDGKNVQVLTFISTVYRELKEYKNAEKYQLMAKKLAPKQPEILTNLGGLFHLMGRLEEAAVEYQEALRYNPNNEILLGNIKRLERAMLTKKKTP